MLSVPGCPQGAKNIFVPITTDRGLCGGINTTVCKYTRAAMHAEGEGEGKSSDMIVIGEKGRSQLQRDMRGAIAATVADTQKVRGGVCALSLLRGIGGAGGGGGGAGCGQWGAGPAARGGGSARRWERRKGCAGRAAGEGSCSSGSSGRMR